MLILTRREGECIWISPNIMIKVLNIWPGRIRIGFEAPADTQIWRAELLEHGLNWCRATDADNGPPPR